MHQSKASKEAQTREQEMTLKFELNVQHPDPQKTTQQAVRIGISFSF